ncbi:MAG: halocyanin, partial [Polyangiaceae bacterium]|nr:halocyanin [Polyangiaceae bacterium]
MNRSIFAWSLIGFVASIGLASCAEGTVFSDEEETSGGEGGSGSGPSGGGAGPTGSPGSTGAGSGGTGM